MNTEPSASRTPALGWVLLVAVVGTFLAGQWLTEGAPWFGSGYVMRAPALALLAAIAVLAAGLVRSAPALPSRRWTCLALLPLVIVVFGLYTASHRGFTLRLRTRVTGWLSGSCPWRCCGACARGQPSPTSGAYW